MADNTFLSQLLWTVRSSGSASAASGSIESEFMNLGIVYFQTFLLVVAVAFLVALGIASGTRFYGWSWRAVVWVAIPIWVFVGVALLDYAQDSTFGSWHQWQNTVVPKAECRTYKPQATRLYASYQMRREAFVSWAESHPWAPESVSIPDGASLLKIDRKELGMGIPELAYQTEMAPNGAQLRAYYAAGVAYISYNSL